MIKIIIAMIEVEIAKWDYHIELNNYKCNHDEEPTKDYIKYHHQFTDKIVVLRDIQQRITSLWEGL